MEALKSRVATLETNLNNMAEVYQHNLSSLIKGFEQTDAHLFVLKRLVRELFGKDFSGCYEEYAQLAKEPHAIKFWLEGASVEEAQAYGRRMQKKLQDEAAQAANPLVEEEEVRTFGGDYGENKVTESDETEERDGRSFGGEHAEDPQSDRASTGIPDDASGRHPGSPDGERAAVHHP